MGYYYLAFTIGKWDAETDAETSKNVMNPAAKVNNRPLRQAIGYAMDTQDVNKHYTNGLTFQVPTLIFAQFGDYFDKSSKGFHYDLKKANQILDKAGYKKKASGVYNLMANL